MGSIPVTSTILFSNYSVGSLDKSRLLAIFTGFMESIAFGCFHVIFPHYFATWLPFLNAFMRVTGPKLVTVMTILFSILFKDFFNFISHLILGFSVLQIMLVQCFSVNIMTGNLAEGAFMDSTVV